MLSPSSEEFTLYEPVPPHHDRGLREERADRLRERFWFNRPHAQAPHRGHSGEAVHPGGKRLKGTRK